MKTTLRLSILFVMVLVQALAPASAGAKAETAAAPSMPPALYSAFLDASAKGAPVAHVQDGGLAWETPGLKTKGSAAGLSVAPQSGNAWTWNLQLDGFGRQGQVASLSALKVTQAGGVMQLSYAPLSEWYRETGIGLEQGFTINQKPAGNGALMLHMQLDTSLSGVVSADGRSVSFATGDGQRLHYSDLRALDASGQELNASLVYSKGQIAIQLDDHAAAYPITVDPLIYIENEQIASDGAAYDNFGFSVAISGDTALVGVPYHQVGSNVHQGVAYIFQRLGGTWVQQAELTASDGANSDYFGYSVAISGDTAVIGAYGLNSARGEAYVFVKPVGGWASGTQTAILTASDGAGGDLFGASVAISGDTVVIGADGHANGKGEAYVFEKPAGGWASSSETTTLTASDGVANDLFGYSVAISGETFVIGAFQHNNSHGEAYLFVKPGGGWPLGTQTEIARLTASDGVANDYFGYSVAISGDTVVIGAWEHSTAHGEAYVFAKPVAGWASGTETARLTASDGALGDIFGISVAISGDTVLIGASNHNSSHGEAYVFVKPGAGWANGTETARLTASDGVANDMFGNSVAISGDTALVGAWYHTVGSNIHQGAAYLFFPYRSEDLEVNAASSSLSPRVGQAVTLAATVTNYGSNPTPIVMLSAPMPTGFSLVKAVSSLGSYDPVTGDWTVASLGAGVAATLNLQTTVTPAAIGTSPVFTAALLGGDANPANNSASVAMNPVPYLGLSPSSIDFGQRILGAGIPFQIVTVTNQTLGSIHLGGLAAPAGFRIGIGFGVWGDHCSGATLAGSATCTFTVQFNATSLGVYSGNISIPSTSPISSSASLPVSGTYIAPVSFSPSSLAFGDQTVGVASPLQTVTMTNLSTADVILGSLAVPAGYMVGVDTCSGATLSASAICIFRVQFKPGSIGAFPANISIPISGISPNINFPVSGNGVPLLSLSPVSLTFVGQTIGTTSPAQTVTVSNQGSSPITFGTFSAPAGFVLSADNCSLKTIPLGSECTFNVQFKPASAVPYSGNISLPATSPHLTSTLAVSGTGLPLLSFSPNPVSFASQLIQTTSPAKTITVTNVSSISATLGTLAAPAGFVLSANTCNAKVLAASGTCTFAVQFKPAAASSYSANITVPVTSPAISFSLHVSGSGVAGTQLLTNPSFETCSGIPPVPTGWAKGGTWVTGDGCDTSQKHTGSRSFKLTGTNVIKSLTFTKTKSGVAGDDFLFSVWRKAASVPAGATLDARIRVYSGTILKATKTVTLPVGTYGFTQSSLPFTMTGTYTKLVVTLEFKGASGTLWFDDASLVWAP